MNHLKALLPVLVAAGTLVLGGPTFAEYPERTIKIIEGYTPGGASDIIARMIAQQLSEKLGESVVVENKPGGATTLAATLVSGSPPDGHLLMMSTLGTAIASRTLDTVTYDYSKDLEKIAFIGYNDFILTVPNSSHINSIDDFIKAGKNGNLTFSSAGFNTPDHMIAEEVGQILGLDLTHVAYSSSTEALNAVLGEEVDFNFSVTSNSAPVINGGKARGIAVTLGDRNKLVPDLPTLSETVIPNYEAVTWYGILGPKGIPAEIVKTLNESINEIVETPKMQEELAKFGFSIRPGDSAFFENFVEGELARWMKVMDKVNNS